MDKKIEKWIKRQKDDIRDNMIDIQVGREI